MSIDVTEVKGESSRIQEKHANIIQLGAVFAASVGIVLAFPFDVPGKIIFASILGVVSAVLLFMFYGQQGANVRIIRCPERSTALLVLAIVSLFATLLLGLGTLDATRPPEADVTYFVRLVVGILQVYCLPGALMVGILGYSRQMTLSEDFVCSVLFSILISSASGFVGMIMGNIAVVGTVVHVVCSTIIIVAAIVIRRRRLVHAKTPAKLSCPLSVNPVGIVLGASIIVFLYSVYWILHSSLWAFPLPVLSDEPFHLGLIRKLLENYVTWQESDLGLFTTPAYPYFFHLTVGVDASLSKLPLLDAYLAISFVLIPLPTVSFYSLTEALARNRYVSMIALVIFQVFSGFGWVFAIALYGAGPEASVIYQTSLATSDVIFSTWLPIIVAPYLVDLAVFFLVLNLAYTHKITGSKLMLLLVSVILVGTSVHVEKIVFLGLVLLVVAVLQTFLQKPFFQVRPVGAALLLSTGLLMVLDFLAPKRLYTATYASAIALLVFTGAAILALSWSHLASMRILIRISELVGGAQFQVAVLACSVLVLIGVAEITFGAVAITHSTTIPLYQIPSKLGWTFVLILVGLACMTKARFRKWTGVTVLLLALVSLEILLYHTPLVSLNTSGVYIEEYRFIRDLLWPVVSIASAYVLFHLLRAARSIDSRIKRLHGNSMIVGGLLIVLVLTTSVFSHLLKVEYFSETNKIDDSAFEVLDFLEEFHVPSGAAILSDARLSTYIYSVTGALVYPMDTPVYGEILSSNEDLAGVMFTLRYLNISYVVAKNDSIGLALDYIVRYSTRIYYDETYSVYAIGALAPPSQESDSTFVWNNPPFGIAFDLGREGAAAWEGNLSSSEAWRLDEVSQGISETCIEPVENDSLHISAVGPGSSKEHLFLATSTGLPMKAEGELQLWIRFRTRPSTSVVAQVFFEDGKQVNALMDGSPYLTSENWTWCRTTSFDSASSITEVRIGVTNTYHEDDRILHAEIQFIGLEGAQSECSDVLAALALAGLNYTTSFVGDYYLENGDRTNVLIDENRMDNATLSEAIRLAQCGTSVVIFGSLQRSLLDGLLLNISSTNRTIGVEGVRIGNNTYPIPSLVLAEIITQGGVVRGAYVGESDVPLLIEVPVGENRALSYLNVQPLLDLAADATREGVNQQAFTIVRRICEEALGIHAAELSEREFYVKSRGLFHASGTVYVAFSSVLFPENQSAGVPSDLEEKLLTINGEVDIEPACFGFLLLAFAENTNVSVDGYPVFQGSEDNARLLLAADLIYGDGVVSFTWIVSGQPFSQLLDGEDYRSVGKYSISISSVTAPYCFLKPLLLQGF